MASEPEVLDGEVVPDTPDAPEQPITAPEAPRQQSHEIVRYSSGSTELVPGATAAERVAVARDIATALNDVIATQGLRTKVGSKKKLDPKTGDPVKDQHGKEVWEPRWHVDVEGWQTLATLLGAAIIPRPPVAAVDPSTGKPILRNFEVHEKAYYKKSEGGGLKHERTWTVEGHDWQVTVDIVKDGALIASGTGLCSRTEKKWIDSDEFAVQSMSATRGASRAVANCARWIVALAGYSTTPSEEMPHGAGADQTPEPPATTIEASPELKTLVKNVIAYLLEADEAAVAKTIDALSKQYEGHLPAAAGQAIVIVGTAVKNLRAAPAAPAEPAS